MGNLRNEVQENSHYCNPFLKSNLAPVESEHNPSHGRQGSVAGSRGNISQIVKN
jgi:hypothetical protein